MLTEILIATLLRAELAGSAGVVLVMLLRPWTRWLIGPRLAYRLWLIPVVSALASLWPTALRFQTSFDIVSSAAGQSLGSGPALLAWSAGALATAAIFVRAELRFRRMERLTLAGPAVVGIWPRLVVPHDYADRFSAAERRLIRRHEQAHMRRRDPVANLFVALASIAVWYNPLVHLARRAIRLDQELACDAVALEDGRVSRKAYGETLLKVQMESAGSWLACAWTGVAGHPLELRVRLLALRRPSLKRDLIGASAVSVLAVAAVALVLVLEPAAPHLAAFPWREALRFAQ